MEYSPGSVTLNVLEQGNGPLSIVFLHYFGGSALEWQVVMNRLSDQYRCLAIDMRGHGNSDAPATGYTVDDMACDITDLIELANVRNFVLVGHSMSGKVALAIAACQPAGLQLLVAVSPSPPVPEPIPDNERKKLLEGHGRRSAAEQTLRNITEVAVSDETQEQIITDDLRTAQVAWNAWLLAGSKEDISARMVSITIPVAIIVGSKDRALPPDVQTRLVLPYLKQATLDTIDQAGHLLPWEVPDKLATFIKKKIVQFCPE